MKEIGLCLAYASCLFTLYNSVIMPLVSRVNRLEKDLRNMQYDVKVTNAELDVIRKTIFIEGDTDDRREI